MKLPELLQNIDPESEMWFRPVSWKGRGEAYCIKYGKTALVPTLDGGDYGMTHEPGELIEDWEIVEPDFVLGER